ncbi:MAG TPA: hypothetical protein VEA59_01835 [Patescibacteria group bacterium]|nr:hypothetical protein [Patescibacteria group bacterium]
MNLIVLYGPYGAGKNTVAGTQLLQALKGELGADVSIARRSTTRDLRSGEEGMVVKYATDEAFESAIASGKMAFARDIKRSDGTTYKNGTELGELTKSKYVIVDVLPDIVTELEELVKKEPGSSIFKIFINSAEYDRYSRIIERDTGVALDELEGDARIDAYAEARRRGDVDPNPKTLYAEEDRGIHERVKPDFIIDNVEGMQEQTVEVLKNEIMCWIRENQEGSRERTEVMLFKK